jgi:hypothetical protein
VTWIDSGSPREQILVLLKEKSVRRRARLVISIHIITIQLGYVMDEYRCRSLEEMDELGEGLLADWCRQCKGHLTLYQCQWRSENEWDAFLNLKKQWSLQSLGYP